MPSATTNRPSRRRHRVAVAHPRPPARRRRQLGRPAPALPGRRDRSPVAAQRADQQPQRAAQVAGVHVGAGEIGRRRPDRDGAHRGQRVVQAAARGDRQPGPDDEAHRAAGHRLGHVAVAHHTGHSQRPAVRPGCAGDVLGVRHGGHPRPQQRAQLLELGPGVVAGHLFAGDDGDLAGHAAQLRRDRVRVAGRGPPLRRNRDSPAGCAVAVALADADPGLLNVLRQQQHRWASGPRRRNGLRQKRNNVVGGLHSPAEHRDRREQRAGVQRSVGAAGVLEAAPAVQRGGGLADQRQHRHPAGERLAESGHEIQRSAARGRGHHPESRSASAVSVGHRGGGELVLGQHRGELRPEMRRVVEVLDVGAVHREEVVGSDRREVADDVVDHPVPSEHVGRHEAGRRWVHDRRAAGPVNRSSAVTVVPR
ncbi:hypothetical protein PICSAR192_02719 [Mycobacterium avium subsp. paratuberculosis]|nr:hypothetical protein PICSAR192_02719 [Mycobacterium avium subsp. paratuberculosis]